MEGQESGRRQNRWNLSPKKRTPIIRKPVKITRNTKWFGDDSTDSIPSSDSSTDDSDREDTPEWEKVERIRKKKEKNLERKEKKKLKMEQLSKKMKHVVGVGPISETTIKHFEKQVNDKNEALILSVREFLNYYLDFDKDELDKLKIREVKKAAKCDVIYLAVENESDVREIHFRKGLAENNDLIVRDYIPPSFYARFMGISSRAATLRGQNKTLKTQIRWGDRDLEVFSKIKGYQEPYKNISLKILWEMRNCQILTLKYNGNRGQT